MEHKKLSKELGLSDVYAIATGAMFSSGFFLLPGLAAAETGPSVFLAYLVSGILVLPTLFSKAELATALPRAGGTYYILDRSLGPLMGSIGGFGSWFSLTFKSAFALIGMGAYISIFFEVPITPIAVILTLAFGALNIFGAKETSLLQKILVAILITIMAFYLVQGFSYFFQLDFLDVNREQFTPFFINGFQGFLGTVGMVFVSYAGLTKVASIAEEVKNPDINIPRGMFLSIFTAIVVYVAGVYLMTAVLEPGAFREDLTPVATAGRVFMDWLPGDTGLILVVIAAIMAFASTGNAGILSSSRFPLAMARDSLLSSKFSKLGKYNTPTTSVVATMGIMIFIILAFNVSEVAKLASAFKLLIFGLLNFAVIVMRESQIEEYDPGYKSPFYPWVQLIGMLVSTVLIFEMGIVSILFVIGVMIFSVGWYYYYSYGKIDRQGAIYHVHARLGKFKDRGLEREMRTILREKGLRREDPYEEMIARADVLEFESDISYEYIIEKASKRLAEKSNRSVSEIHSFLSKMDEDKVISIADGVVLNHARISGEILPRMVMVRIKSGFEITKIKKLDNQKVTYEKLQCILFFIGSDKTSGQHLRMLSHIAERVGANNFLQRWVAAENRAELKEILLRDERFIRLTLSRDNGTRVFIGKMIKDITLPGQSLITIIRRNGAIKIPHGVTVLQENDELLIIGDKDDISKLRALQ
ncbi:MAG: amino acid permease [Balneolaceae bacterium]|nr:amino acid permease [Balneolaceae bacterium]